MLRFKKKSILTCTVPPLSRVRQELVLDLVLLPNLSFVMVSSFRVVAAGLAFLSGINELVY